MSVVSFGSVGDNVVVAGVPGKRILVTGLVLVFASDVTLTFKRGSTALSGSMPFLANGSLVLDPLSHNQGAWLETEAGEAFIANLSLGVTTTGWVLYRLRE